MDNKQVHDKMNSFRCLDFLKNHLFSEAYFFHEMNGLILHPLMNKTKNQLWSLIAA